MNTSFGRIRTGHGAPFQRSVFMGSGPVPSGHPGMTSRQEEILMDVIDLNCDMGESFGAWTMGSDAVMLKIVSSANVACGFHGGDPLVMFDTVTRAKQDHVGIGAHPSFFDVWGFGRRTIQGEKPEDTEKMVVYQIGALQGVAPGGGSPRRPQRRARHHTQHT